MGLSHFPTPAEGVFPLLVINTVLSVSLLKNILRFVLHIVCSQTNGSPTLGDDPDENISKRRRISTTQFRSLSQNREEEQEGGCKDRSVCGGNESSVECCVCLCSFEAEEEVSELQSCKHFFHRGCLDKWFGNNQTSCPLCRSIL